MKKSELRRMIKEEILKEKIDKSILKKDNTFLYQLLSRMQYDCEYVIHTKSSEQSRPLWGGKDHIEYMVAIWNKLPKKPEWLSMKQIKDYAKSLGQKI